MFAEIPSPSSSQKALWRQNSYLFEPLCFLLHFQSYLDVPNIWVHIRMIKHTARTSLTEALMVKTTQDLNVLPLELTSKILYNIYVFHHRFPSVHQIILRYYEFWKNIFHMDQFIIFILVISLEPDMENFVCFTASKF